MLAVFLVGIGYLTRSSLSEEGVVWAHGVRVDTVIHHGGKAWWGKQLSDVVATVRLLVHIWANQETVNKK